MTAPLPQPPALDLPLQGYFCDKEAMKRPAFLHHSNTHRRDGGRV